MVILAYVHIFILCINLKNFLKRIKSSNKHNFLEEVGIKLYVSVLSLF